MRILLFTDLDGTLLNHTDYSWSEAEPALQRLRALDVPVVLVSSKTRAEIEILQHEMGLEEPFVVENGGGIFVPERYEELEIPDSTIASPYRLRVLGRSYFEIRSFVENYRDRFSMEGFGDMGVDRIVELTGLPRDQARLAERREFTEPFLLEDESHLAELCGVAATEQLAITTGGRFHHLMGDGQDKGRAVRVVTEIFRSNWEGDLVTIGLGDSLNDLPMLEEVDHPVVIPGVSRELQSAMGERATIAGAAGCRGWNEAVSMLVERLYSGNSPAS